MKEKKNGKERIGQKTCHQRCTNQESIKAKSQLTRSDSFITKPNIATALFSKFSRVFILCAALILFSSLMVNAYSLIPLQGNANYNGSAISSGNLTVIIYNQQSGGSIIYNSTSEFNNAIVNGKFDVVLGDGSQKFNLLYGVNYYLDMYINGQNLDFNGSDRRKFQSSYGNVSGIFIESNSINSTHIQDSSITDSDINAGAGISKSKISSSGSWVESEIPSLSSSWIGTLNASRIVSGNLLNANSSQYLGSTSLSQLLSNDSNILSFIITTNATASSKAATGNCPEGTVIMNITSTGIQCITDKTGEIGGVTQITAGTGLTGGIITTTGTISLNTTYTDGRYYASGNGDSLADNITNLNATFINRATQLQNNINSAQTNITNVNTSGNIKGLGFNLTSELSTWFNTLYATMSNLASVASNITSVNASVINEINWRTNNQNSLASNISSTQAWLGTTNTTVNGLVSNDSSLDMRISQLNSSKANLFAVNCSSGSVVKEINGSSVVCVNDQTGTAGLGLELEDLFTRRYYSREAMFESVTAAYNEPWAPVAINGGTVALFAGTYDHPGTAQMSTSATASSGYTFQITGTSTYLLGENYTTQVVFMPLAKSGNVTRIKFGFLDVFTNLSNVDGAYFNITQNGTNTFIAQGVNVNNSISSFTTTNFTLMNGTWYGLKIYVFNRTHVDYKIYVNSTRVWMDTAIGRVPTITGRETSNAFVAYVLGATTAVPISRVDYMSVGVNSTLNR